MSDIRLADGMPTFLLEAPIESKAVHAQVSSSVTTDGMPDYLLESPKDSRPSRSGLSSEPIPGWSEAYQGFMNRTQLGLGGLTRSLAGWKMAVSDETFENAQKEVETQSLLQAQTDKEDYINTHHYWQLAGVKVGDSDLLGGWLAESLPALGASLGVGVLGGSAVAATVGAPIAGGVAVGTALAFGAISGGNMVYELMQRGVDRDTARFGGLASGIAGGALGLLGLGAAGEGATAAAATVAQSAGFRQALGNVSGQLLKSTGVQVGAQAINSLSDSIVKWITTRTSKGSRPFTAAEFTEEFTQAMLQAFVVAPQIAGATTGFGAGAGELARRVGAEVDRSTADFLLKLKADEEAKLKIEEQREAARDAETKERTAAGQVKAKKQLRGFVEVRETPTVETAVQALEEARQQLEQADGTADRAIAQLVVDYAQASLKEAELAARLEAVEDALTDPKAGAELRAKLDQQKSRIQRQADKVRLQGSEAALKRRIGQRERVISQLRAEIRDAKEQARLAGSAADTAESRARLEQLREQHELDELLLQLFAEKLVSPDEVSYLRPQVPGKRLAGIVKVAKRQVENAAQAGEQAQRQTGTQIRKLLDALINTARLPQKDRLALKAKLSKIQTFAQLQKALPELETNIQDLFEKRRTQAARTDLARLLDSIAPKSGSPSKAPGSEEALVIIKEFARDPEAVSRLAQELEQKDTLAPSDEMRSELAQLFPDSIENLSADQIERIIDAVVELREEGKTEALRRFHEKQERQKANEEAWWKHAAISPSGEPRSKESKRSTIQQALSGDPLKAPGRTWEGLMYLLTQLGTMSDLREVFDLKSAHSNMWRTIQEWSDRWKELIAESGLTEREYAKAVLDGEKRSAELTYGKDSTEVIDGEEFSFIENVKLDDPATGDNYTLMELVQIRNYLLDRDPDAISRLSRGNNYSYPGQVPPGTSTLEVIETYFAKEAPDLLKIADAMQELYREFHGVVDDAVYRRWGRRIAMNETYGGPLLTGDAYEFLQLETARRSTLRPGSMLARQGGSNRVTVNDALANLTGHIRQFARESAFLQFEQDAQALFGKQEVRDFITRHFGKDTLSILDQYIRDVIRGPQEVETVISKILTRLRRNAFNFYLGGRPDQYAKQLTGFIHALQVSSPRAVLDGYAYFFSNYKQAVELMNKSPLLRARRMLLDPDFKPTKASKLEGLRDLMMRAVEAGDVAAVHLSAFPALLETLRKTGDEKAAIAAFERAFEQTQGSGSIDELPHIYRSGVWARMLTIFTQQANRQVEMISVAWDKFLNAPTKASFAEFANTAVVSYLGATLYPLAGWVVLSPFLDSEKSEQRLKEILAIAPLGPYAALPVWGLVLTPLMLSGFNLVFDDNLHVFTPEFLATDTLGSFLKAGSSFMKAGDGDSEHFWNALVAAADVLGRVTGLPTHNALKLVSPAVGGQGAR